MRRALATVTTMLLLGVSCGGDDDGAGTSDTSRVEATVLLDLDVTLPDDVGGVDLGELAPDDDLTFCDAFAAVPTRWVDDAVVPLQYWIDTWSGVDDEPPEATEALTALRDFGDQKLDWNFKRQEERPIYDEAMARHAVTLADTAVERCPDLPLVVGLNPAGLAPVTWAGETDASIDGRCGDFVDRVEQGMTAYADLTGRQPRHVAQLEAELYLEWAHGDGELFVSNDFVGVEIGEDGAARATPIPGGACDR